MINNLCILFSLAMVVYVVARAAMLDAKRPWFEKTAPTEPPGHAPPRRRRGAEAPCATSPSS